MKKTLMITIICSLFVFCSQCLAMNNYTSDKNSARELIQAIDSTFEIAMESLKAQWTSLREKAATGGSNKVEIITEKKEFYKHIALDKGFDQP